MSRDCDHGQLARSCNICDLERELKAVTQQRDKLLAALEYVLDTNLCTGDDGADARQRAYETIAEVKGLK